MLSCRKCTLSCCSIPSCLLRSTPIPPANNGRKTFTLLQMELLHRERESCSCGRSSFASSSSAGQLIHFFSSSPCSSSTAVINQQQLGLACLTASSLSHFIYIFCTHLSAPKLSFFSFPDGQIDFFPAPPFVFWHFL